MKLSALLLLLLPLPVWAADIGGVVFPERWTLDKTELVLNGAGLREYGVLGIDVYAAALYLTRPEHDAGKLLLMPGPKVLHMQFFRDIKRDDTLKVWDYSFRQNCPAPCVLPTAEIAAFQALIPDSRSGDAQTYRFYADRVDLLANSQVIGSVQGAAFARLLLSTWIGIEPPTLELKAALLGNPQHGPV